MRFSISHTTQLEFTKPVYEHHCELRLSPRFDPFQKVLFTEIEVTPDSQLSQYTDAFGNTVQYFNVLKPHQSLKTVIRSEVETTLQNPFEFPLVPPDQESAWYRRRLQEDPLLWQYVLHRSVVVPEWSSLDAMDVPPPSHDREKPVMESILKAVDWSATVLHYETGSSHTHSKLQDVLHKGQGVCQDFAHLLISLVRSWNIPARYVMGYLNASADGPGNAQQEQSSHAWVEVLIPGAGWRGFDATNRLCANDHYIPVAVGRDSFDAAPQRGTFKGSGAQQAQTIHVALQQQQ